MKNYLTEKSLGEALTLIFPNHEFINNKSVPNSGIRKRPDFRNDELKLIVEFDGDRHYTESANQQSDDLKRMTYGAMGYKVVNIPYFVQLSSATIKYYFDVDVCWEQIFPHGFITEKCVTPADFNSLGIRLYIKQLKDMMEFSEEMGMVAIDIIKSIQNRITKAMGDGEGSYAVLLNTWVGVSASDMLSLWDDSIMEVIDHEEEYKKLFIGESDERVF